MKYFMKEFKVDIDMVQSYSNAEVNTHKDYILEYRVFGCFSYLAMLRWESLYRTLPTCHMILLHS